MIRAPSSSCLKRAAPGVSSSAAYYYPSPAATSIFYEGLEFRPVKRLFESPSTTVDLARVSPVRQNTYGQVTSLPKLLVLKRVQMDVHSASRVAFAEIEAYRRLRRTAGSKLLVSFFFAARDGDRLVLALEYCAGNDLHTLIYSDDPFLADIVGRFTLMDIVFYLAELAAALQFIHRNGIYHGDVKLANVFLSATGHVKLGDYGESHILPDGPSEAGLQRARASTEWDADHRASAGDIVTAGGTIPYCAPEILFRRPHRFEPDWWSYGVIACELLVGGTPFGGAYAESDEVESCEQLAVHMICFEDMEALLSKVEFPCSIARTFVEGLLRRDMRQRTGDLHVKLQPLFQCIEWTALERLECKPPYIPRVGY